MSDFGRAGSVPEQILEERLRYARNTRGVRFCRAERGGSLINVSAMSAEAKRALWRDIKAHRPELVAPLKALFADRFVQALQAQFGAEVLLEHPGPGRGGTNSE